MKTPIAAAALVALAALATTPASAYHLSPPNVSARLHGNLTFNPNEGNTQPFKCGVTLDLKTKKGQIKSIKFTKFDCEGVRFIDLPWQVFNLSQNMGEFGEVSYESGDGNCQQVGVQFQDNNSGIWTLAPGQCLSGTLTSNPPVTIVP